MAINHYFETLMAWHIDNGVFYLSGRDIACAIVGFIVCLILWAIFDGKEVHIGWKSERK